MSAASSTRLAGLLLLICSPLSVGFIVYHPVMRSRNLAALADEFAQQAFVNGMVHGCVIALMWIILVCLSLLSTALGGQRLLVRLALASFALATLAMTAAALLSGFIIPEFVAGFQHKLLRATPEPTAEQWLPMSQIMGLARAGNQVCSRVGVLCSALAWLGWSLAMQGTTFPRWLSWLGVVAGLGLAASLLLGYLPMDVHGMMVYVGVQTVWTIGVGWMLWRSSQNVNVLPSP